jgi:predicted nuclease of restriction endonuclease-like (RecB) superfamily
MKAKTENIKISIESHLPIDLSKIIENKHRELLRVTNSELVTLFWEIGKALNQYFDGSKRFENSKSTIQIISTNLVANYGPYFSEKNLKKMRQFADQFTDYFSVAQIAPFITWEHLLLLLQIQDLEVKLFYIRLTVEQELSISILRKQISSNSYEPPMAFNDSKEKRFFLTQNLNSKKFLQLLQPSLEKTTYNKVIKNLFKEPLLSSFRPLLEPSKSPAKVIKKNKISSSNEELFGVLSGYIEKYRCKQNKWLNANLNLLFWEIGKRINREIILNNASTLRESVIHNTSVHLKKKYSNYFNENLLQEMGEFARQITDFSISSRIAYLVSWEHIMVLLSLRELEAKLFYARLTATEGLSVTTLQKQIAKGVYKQKSEPTEQEQNTITALQNPSIETRVEKKANATIISTTKFIDLGDDANSSLVVTNIFKNHYFLDFITAF